jgi:DNA (cytosine-5)-methyltransferase 1
VGQKGGSVMGKASSRLIAADLFCGAGGTSIGAESTGLARVGFALNHWSVAVETHAANFPHARHVNSRLDQVSPSECQRIDLLFASPECTHHSRARGGRPTSDQQRAGAWDVMKWIEFHRPSFVVIENVSEFEHWGPVGNDGRPLCSRRGAFFEAWVNAIRSAGYAVDWRLLNAADYGAPTSRTRLFVIARKGRRAPVWPEPTHQRDRGRTLPGMGLPHWIPAREAIDWSLPCPSIFSRKRPLAHNTLQRIQAGIERHVGAFVTNFVAAKNAAGGNWSVTRPMPTIVTRSHLALTVPFVCEWTNTSNATGGHRSVAMPLPTVLTKAHMGLAVPFTVAVNHGGCDNRSRSLDLPTRTLCAIRGEGLVVPWLCHYYGNSDTSPVSEPLDTITTVDRHALTLATLRQTCAKLAIVDVGFRMLQNHELAAAQGFPNTYQFRGSRDQITRQIGNSVSPPVAAAITRAIASC